MRFFVLFVFLLSFSQVAFANAQTQLEKIYQMENASSSKNIFQKEEVVLKTKPIPKEPYTNYQYDEQNYHYDKYQKYIDDNIKYSQSGRMKY